MPEKRAKFPGVTRELLSKDLAVAHDSEERLSLRLGFSTQPPSSVAACGSFGALPIVAIQDALGNVVSSATDSVTLSSYTDSLCTIATGTALTVAPAASNTLAGLAQFTNLSFPTASGIYIKANSNTLGLTSGCSQIVTVNAGAASKLAFVTPPSATGNAGNNLASQPRIAIQDACGNTVTLAGNNITLGAFSDSGCSASSTPTLNVTTNPMAPTLGQATFAGVNYTKSGTIYIGAQASALTTACSPAVVISGGTAASLVVSSFPSPTTAGANHSFNVTAYDSFGNIATGYNGTVNFTSSDGAAVLPGAYTFVAGDFGTKNFAGTLKTVGTQSITATDAGNALVNSQTGITVNAGTADHLSLIAGNAQSASVATAVAIAPKVKVLDGFNNAVPGVVLTFTVTGGGGSVGSSSVTSDSSGFASTSYTMGTVAGINNNTMTVAGQSALPGVPATITFTETATAGGADHLALIAGNSQSATVATSVATAPKVQVQDAFNNPLAGTVLTFTVTGGGGSVGSSPITSDAAGNATTSFTLGTVAGTNNNTMVVARQTTALPGVPATLTFTESATAGADNSPPARPPIVPLHLQFK